MTIVNLITIVVCIWIVFFNGSEKLENTVLGYFEFGQLAEKTVFIKILAGLTILATLGFMAKGISS